MWPGRMPLCWSCLYSLLALLRQCMWGQLSPALEVEVMRLFLFVPT